MGTSHPWESAALWIGTQAELVTFRVSEHDPPDAVAFTPKRLAVPTLVNERSAEADQALDLCVRFPGSEVHMHPVLARGRVIDSHEQNVTNAPMVGRSKPHEVVTLVDNAVAGDLGPEAAEGTWLFGIEGDVVDVCGHGGARSSRPDVRI